MVGEKDRERKRDRESLIHIALQMVEIAELGQAEAGNWKLHFDPHMDDRTPSP